jgi:thiamine-phosphate pyrophosphorylase
VNRPIDLRLYLVTDRGLAGSRSVEEVAAAAVRGGFTAVQLREKKLSGPDFVEAAFRLQRLLSGAGVPLIINDRVDVALAAGADGIHLGQGDIPPAEARRALGPKAIIGLSLEAMSQLPAAESQDIDYLGVSPVFLTPTKTDAGPGWGLEGLRRLRSATRLPLVAIGGITAANAASVLAAGADGIAVVSAIMSAPDPEAAARELRAIVDLRRSCAGRSEGS